MLSVSDLGFIVLLIGLERSKQRITLATSKQTCLKLRAACHSATIVAVQDQCERIPIQDMLASFEHASFKQ